MTLIKFITFPRPVSPAQLPAATDEALSISTSKLLRSQHPAAHRGARPPQHPGVVHVGSDKPTPAFLSGLVLAVFSASADLPSRKAGPTPTSAPSGHQVCPWCPQAASPRESGSGSGWGWDTDARLCAPHRRAVLCHPGLEGTLMSPEAEHLSQKRLCRPSLEPSPCPLHGSRLPFLPQALLHQTLLFSSRPKR